MKPDEAPQDIQITKELPPCKRRLEKRKSDIRKEVVLHTYLDAENPSSTGVGDSWTERSY